MATDPTPPTPARVLLVEADDAVRRSLKRTAGQLGYEVFEARDVESGIATLARRSIDVVVTDLCTPDARGIELVRRVRALDREMPVVSLSARERGEASEDGVSVSAFWVLDKPFEGERSSIGRLLASAVLQHRSRRQSGRTRAHKAPRATGSAEPVIAGCSPALEHVLALADQVADSEATVLVTGESGTGKELVARRIHARSGRRSGPCVAVNSGAIPEELLESELFGHVRGAFTHAMQTRVGRFAQAAGGTLFLDEIGDMSPKLQVKLLRVLQDGTYQPLGSSRVEHSDARIIAATHQDLARAMREQRFRADLFYRLNVVPIHIAPLRERREDVPVLAEHFLERAKRRGEPVEGITARAMDALCAHTWPGNVRELENRIERALVLREGTCIDLDALGTLARDDTAESVRVPRLSPEGICLADVVGRVETDLIHQALEQTCGNKTRAARLLGVNRTTLLEMIKKRGIAPPAKPKARGKPKARSEPEASEEAG